MAEKFIETNRFRRLIHNDLRGGALWHLQVSEEKFEKDEKNGVGHDMLASLLLHFFYAEAVVNFVGHHRLEDGWPERASFREKVGLLNKLLSAGLSPGERPLDTVLRLKKFRDLMAHGKPEIGIERRVVDENSDLFAGLRGKWKDYIDLKFLQQCNKDIEQLSNTLFEKAGIEEWETMTRVHGSTKRVEDE